MNSDIDIDEIDKDMGKILKFVLEKEGVPIQENRIRWYFEVYKMGLKDGISKCRIIFDRAMK